VSNKTVVLYALPCDVFNFAALLFKKNQPVLKSKSPFTSSQLFHSNK